MNLTTKSRNRVYDYIYTNTSFSSMDLKKKFRTVSYNEFDNSVGRFVRRMVENGYLTRKNSGQFRLTARGRRFIERA